MERWISQDVKDEMWNNVHGVYGTCQQQTDVGAVDDGTDWSGGAVHGSGVGEHGDR